MDKSTNAKLMNIAERILNADRNTCPLFKRKDAGNEVIYESYNGQISSLGVSILTIGLKPSISVFYQDAPKQEGEYNDAYRRVILEVIAKMLSQYRDNYHFNNSRELCRAVINDARDSMKTDIINCSIALKEVIRTYKLG